ncbi:MAG: exonuclease domain-containing protein [Candidatus Hodgkinia cicadicola]
MREIIIDTETTGLNPRKDRVIELAIIEFKLHGPLKELYHSYFDPAPVEVSKGAFEIHGITNEFLKAQPKFKAQAKEVLQLVKGSKLIAHNAKFDKQMLTRELKLADLVMPNTCWYDTLKLAKLLNPSGSNSLRALCKRHKIGDASAKHNALSDCKLLALVYRTLLAMWAQLSCNESWFNNSASITSYSQLH